MDDSKSQIGDQAKKPTFQGTCPFCLSIMDVFLDIKDRPYWRCWRCEIRSFGTKTALKTLTADGWIWTTERPLDAIQGWLTRLATSIGFPIAKPKGKDGGDAVHP